ncbi:MAG: cobyric acid synthase CobQ [Gammaproteobacteria bacterium]|nr:cobyric acid synthase CobQ [Gammaproteobacteria bacterium]
MVLGCTSGAGKSWIATALCRWYARKGVRVAPFKAQNMSNHARVVALADGGDGEMGSAQYFQALAAGVPPEVRMNPVLLKPESDTRSQVVVLGRVREDLHDRPWRDRSDLLWEAARSAYLSLSSDYDLIVIEGAGSPAEINLTASDFVNTRTALLSAAACLLVADIDRGGAFAHLYGTHQLMHADVRAQVRGFVLNRFRGDPLLLAPGPEDLKEITGVPTVAVVPLVRDHGVPDEDEVPRDSPAAGPRFVVVAAPHASNLDEFEPLRAAGARVTFVRDARAIEHADWLILPGSKQTRADLSWLKRRGFHGAILAHLEAKRPVLAVCGGLQLLGERLDDPDGLEGAAGGSEPGLGVLPIVTHYAPDKQLSRARARFAVLEGPWQGLSNLDVAGYEIHLGRTRPVSGASTHLRTALMRSALSGEAMIPTIPTAGATATCLGWQYGTVLGVYLHGLLENPAVLAALTGSPGRSHESEFDGVADVVEHAFTPGFLDSLY